MLGDCVCDCDLRRARNPRSDPTSSRCQIVSSELCHIFSDRSSAGDRAPRPARCGAMSDTELFFRGRDLAVCRACCLLARPAERSAWWSQTGSNRRPPACKAGALPTELWPHQRTEGRCRRTERLRPTSVIRHLSSGWWAWEDLNFRPHAYQACALTN